MSTKTLFTALLVVVVALMGIVNVVEAQYGSYNYGSQPSNYLSAYPQQFAYGDGYGADSWQRSVVSHVLWP